MIHVRQILGVFETTLFTAKVMFPVDGEIVIYWDALSDDISNINMYAS